MRICLGILCFRKAFRLDETQEARVSTSGEKPAPYPHQKCAKVHPAPPPLSLPAPDQPLDAPLPQRMDGGCVSKRRSVKIVVTKKQLKAMIKNPELTGISVQFADTFWDKGRSPRWRPSLATIAE